MTSDRRDLHPVLGARERQRLFREGIELFDRGSFFAAHEKWEEIWRSTTPEPRDLFQGLIQIAVGFHHYCERRRLAPAGRLLSRGSARLTPFSPVTHGLAVSRLLEQVGAWQRWLAEPAGIPPALPVLEVVAEEEVR